MRKKTNTPKTTAAKKAAAAETKKTVVKAEPEKEVKAEVKAEPKKEVKAEVKAEPKKEVKAEAKAEPKKEVKAEAKAEPKKEVKAEAKAEPKKEVKAETKVEPKKEEKVEVKAEPKKEVKAEGKIEPKKEVKAKAKAEPKKEVKAEVKTEPKKEEKVEVKAEPKKEVKAEAKTEPKKEEKVEVKAEPKKIAKVKAEPKAEPKKTVKAETKAEDPEKKKREMEDAEYHKRFTKHADELKWLYMELYQNEWMYSELCSQMYEFYRNRKDSLKNLDRKREANPSWYKKNDMLGMMLYVDNFAGNLQGVKSKLDYLKESNVNYVHLMPLLESPKGRSDGGYAVADFRKVQPELGTMEDLEEVTESCHERDMSVCMDFVMNHTSEDHEWARRARAGEGEYMSRYFFYDNYNIPAMFERTVPQVFPTTAPGNFTYLPEIGHYVMTSFYPYQWDLNYRNPRVFNEMMYNFLFFANVGIDVIRIDAVPYIWKELGTDCRNLPRVHTIVRMMRMIGEIVCPGIVLLGEVVMEPSKVVPYFGSVEKPECHMLYNVTTMATTWNSLATRDTRLLKGQMDTLASLPKDYVFLNYLRCHDDIGWGLDYPTLSWWGMDERSHKQYINDFFTGNIEGSYSRGELYNADPVTGDARFCGTTASMCGVEKAGFEMDEEQMKHAIHRVLMLHAFMFTESGIPMLYSGDEVGQTNDYSYKNVPEKAADSRYIHRGAFRWELVDDIKKKGSVSERIYDGLAQLEKIRASEKAFMSNAAFWTLETYEQSILCIAREYEGEKIIGLFNFSEFDKTAWINEQDGEYVDLLTGNTMAASGVGVPGNGFFWLKRK